MAVDHSSSPTSTPRPLTTHEVALQQWKTPNSQTLNSNKCHHPHTTTSSKPNPTTLTHDSPSAVTRLHSIHSLHPLQLRNRYDNPLLPSCSKFPLGVIPLTFRKRNPLEKLEKFDWNALDAEFAEEFAEMERERRQLDSDFQALLKDLYQWTTVSTVHVNYMARNM